ncbi:hypothetical protein MSAN_01021300 [Mycena sanguinolenta]|uniref:Uncharacterized protein n=1 Tax=Mycena sanguinolenta TaxID=230812 RepID=A0A8H7D9H1_9AGAR|nr:hypothetical protein MSAN_01021300 [Mycena sanguinolenta]
MLDKLPPEICGIIFDFACRDGRTGLALSHVSRYIRNTSELARYTSIALVSYAQIIAFAQFVEHTRIKLKTRHLFINGQASEKELERMLCEANAGLRKAQLEYRRLTKVLPRGGGKWGDARDGIARERANASKLLGREGARAVESILRTVGPTLEVLDISLNEYAAEMLLNPISLPCLVDLTTRCGFPLRPGDDVPALEPTHSLRYLHIVDSPRSWVCVDGFFRDGISYFAPSLTHLRLSELYEDEVGIKELGCALGHSDNLDHDPPSQIPLLSTTLELVVLKPAGHPHKSGPDGPCCDEVRDYDNLVRLARWLRDKDTRVLLLKADSAPLAEDSYFQEWLDKVDGAVCKWDRVLMHDLDLYE